MVTALKKQLSAVWDVLLSKLSLSDKPFDTPKEKDFFEMVEEAHQEWDVALSRFNHVTDPDLVDFAIHSMEAAEKKYTFLLKKARQEGYRLPGRIDALRERRMNNAGI